MINVKDYLIKLEGKIYYEKFIDFVDKVLNLTDDEIRELYEITNREWFLIQHNMRIFKWETIEKRSLKYLKKDYYDYSEILLGGEPWIIEKNFLKFSKKM